MAGVRPSGGQWTATRRVVARSCTGSHAVSVRAQLATGAIIFALSAWVTVTSVSYIGSRHLLSDTAQHIKTLEQAYADLRSESQLSTESFIEQIDELETIRRRQDEAIRELTQIRDTVERQLNSRERQLATLAEERDRARGRVGELQQSLSGLQDRLHDTLADRSDLRDRLDGAEQRLAAASRQRDAERQAEVGLRWHVARLEDELKELRSQRESAQVWLKDWVLGSTEALEQLFGETGVDVETLIARADRAEMGQGGPLQVAGPGPEAPGDKLAQLTPDPMQNDLQRLAALQKLARTLPLSSPLDHFYLTSGYGKRRDPFTRQLAFHAGLDFGAALGSKVLATAPGHVIHAGSAGPYGNMVEIDHGMGIITRYGHLKSVTVKEGDEVRFRQAIGVIGSTGRSTALHLHYEIRIDDTAYDPARFLHAGRFMVGIFASPAGSPVEEVAGAPSNG
jgi:murein DD-endopeptidase MepM/ murein hydrolase activator NlpD